MDFQRPSLGYRLEDALVRHGLLRSRYRAYAHSLGLHASERVLEVGGGTGALSRHLAGLLTNGGELVCVDTSRPLLNRAARRLRRWPHVELRCGLLSAEQIGLETVDTVVVHRMLHDVPAMQRLALVRAMSDVLKVGGRLLLREPVARHHGVAPAEVRSLIQQEGLREVRSRQERPLLGTPIFSAEYTRPKAIPPV